MVFDPDAATNVEAGDLHFRHKLSPYLGAVLRGRVLETWLRGEPVFSLNLPSEGLDGHFPGKPRGRELARR